MENIYKLLWTENALQELNSIIAYLENNWTKKEIKKFSKRINKLLNLIQTNPELFPKTNIKKNIRKSILTKQNTIYYKFEDGIIYILSVFDNRQNPDKLKI
jgi:plasmid stabilization system protein ParE